MTASLAISLASWTGWTLLAAATLAAFAVDRLIRRVEPAWRRTVNRYSRRCTICGPVMAGTWGDRYCPGWLAHLARLENHPTRRG